MAWNRAALAIIHWATTLNPQATMEVNRMSTNAVTNSVMRSAATWGNLRRSALCNGQTMATMNSAKTKGAKMERAK